MARMIDADALGIGKCDPDVFDDKGYAKGWNSAIEILQNAPTVDAVAVVRCKDCKYAAPNGKYGCSCYHFKKYETHEMTSNDYCSHGERKEGDE